jgi:hypothetical protein
MFTHATTNPKFLIGCKPRSGLKPSSAADVHKRDSLVPLPAMLAPDAMKSDRSVLPRGVHEMNRISIAACIGIAVGISPALALADAPAQHRHAAIRAAYADSGRPAHDRWGRCKNTNVVSVEHCRHASNGQ